MTVTVQIVVFVLYTLLSVLYLFVFVFFAYTIYAMISGAPFVPTAKKNVRSMIRLAKLRKGDKLLDIGSGDGRILFMAAKTGALCQGVELNPLLFWLSRLKKRFSAHRANITIERKDLWKTDFAEVDVLTLFFIAPKMKSLMRKILREMKSGSRVVSYGFTFPNWEPIEKYEKVYLYIVP